MALLVAVVAAALAVPLTIVVSNDQRAAFVSGLQIDTLTTAATWASQPASNLILSGVPRTNMSVSRPSPVATSMRKPSPSRFSPRRASVTRPGLSGNSPVQPFTPPPSTVAEQWSSGW